MDGDAALALGALNLDRGFKGGEGNVLVGGVGGDAVLARAEDGEHAVVAIDSRTPGARLPLVARVGGVAEIDATGALEQIAGGGSHIAQLGRSAGEQGLREDWVVSQHRGVLGYIGVASESSDDQAARGAGLDLIERKSVDVDDLARALDVEFHEVDQSRAASDKADLRALLGCRGLGSGLDRLIDGGGLREDEAIHDWTP
jgi:hypothetical protein